MFSAEFRQEMQKEIERNLNLRNEIRHRIITADTASLEYKKKSQEGLKYLVSERESGGLASLSTSTSSSTNSSILSTVMKKEMIHTAAAAAHNNNPTNTTHHTTSAPSTTTATTASSTTATTEEETKAPVLRPASFLTGFGGFGSETGLGIGGMAGASFITRGIPPRTFTSSSTSIPARGSNNEPSISTRFFQRLASRIDDYDKKTVQNDITK